MEEVHAASSPEDGQLPNELPDPLNTPKQPSSEVPPYAPPFPLPNTYPTPNTTSMRNANLEATYDINTLPRPVEESSTPAATPEAPATPARTPETPATPEVPQTPEAEFDKRNERLRPEPRQQDELAAAGMVALGDVLKNRQKASNTPPYPAGGTMATPASRPNPASPTPKPAAARSLYKQAVMVGFTAALIMAPIVIYILATR